MSQLKESTMLTAAEAEVMNIVWDVGDVTISDIVERLPRSLAYTTVMTTTRILEEKGYVKKSGKRGRAFVYEPRVGRDAARGSMSHEVARRLFGGSMKSLVLNLVHDDAIGADDLAELKQMIESLEASK
ncbi:Penicillinase repressor [Botrimarina colliarenosi]|uniref:Penicillinase repressor n=1 Tax=Botrimarina colliarenosi TaxID=2528001 RepID=A0A5C6AEW7_9BACT|nr:BlaI/MecI/CopY family transcriptional regulator [Botrimarina colliarenosi]TWT98159.1 Penicillinase repressor [Botrimarina colliarenosi]